MDDISGMTEDDWKAKLTPDQYHILRERGTEYPGTGKLLHNDKTGDYTCAGCGNVLFNSATKFESNEWPSFYNVVDQKAIRVEHDDSFGMARSEVFCAKCGGALGHVFNDSPEQPTGLRFCINSAALDFKPEKS
ncbi:MAG: methionine-R-sulfoxide reductase [Candidatus Saccharibacteria bacterium]|nr:methionine-R-sulfoxide reductase [Candidatus Saccharibacteria bacterium]